MKIEPCRENKVKKFLFSTTLFRVISVHHCQNHFEGISIRGSLLCPSVLQSLAYKVGEQCKRLLHVYYSSWPVAWPAHGGVRPLPGAIVQPFDEGDDLFPCRRETPPPPLSPSFPPPPPPPAQLETECRVIRVSRPPQLGQVWRVGRARVLVSSS